MRRACANIGSQQIVAAGAPRPHPDPTPPARGSPAPAFSFWNLADSITLLIVFDRLWWYCGGVRSGPVRALPWAAASNSPAAFGVRRRHRRAARGYGRGRVLVMGIQSTLHWLLFSLYLYCRSVREGAMARVLFRGPPARIRLWVARVWTGNAMRPCSDHHSVDILLISVAFHALRWRACGNQDERGDGLSARIRRRVSGRRRRRRRAVHGYGRGIGCGRVHVSAHASAHVIQHWSLLCCAWARVLVQCQHGAAPMNSGCLVLHTAHRGGATELTTVRWRPAKHPTRYV
jgi:hypothetical protein